MVRNCKLVLSFTLTNGQEVEVIHNVINESLKYTVDGKPSRFFRCCKASNATAYARDLERQLNAMVAR